MFDQDKLESIRDSYEHWEETTLQQQLAKHPESRDEFITVSSREMQRLYTPLDVADLDYERDLGMPGEYPFTRGVHPTMYRGRPWTMRMFAGYGTAEETNARFKYLREHGETGLSVAFDYPTLYGYDTDDPEAIGEFGKCGVAISSMKDMQILFDGIPMGEVTTSMTINGPAAVVWAMYIAAAEAQGYGPEQLGGTIQNDILKEYIAQKSWIFPPEPSMRLIVDTFEHGSKYLPRWNTISISGYHIREAGATAIQELAFTLADGLAYVQAAVERGLDADEFAPRLSFFFNAHNDFFEEIAKYRAARRIWAREMRERFQAQDPRSWWLRFHTQTAGVSLTAQQPENNVARVAIQALAAVLGGTQSLHTNSMDEALALPSALAARIALRTQQIINHESGVANSVDPLAGSFLVESLTNQMEEETYEIFDKIEELGGVIPAIEVGYFQQEIAQSAYRYQREIDTHKRIVVGVNEYRLDEPLTIPLLKMDPEGYERQVSRLDQLKRERDNDDVQRRLDALRQAAEGTDNLMPYILDAVRAHATLGETCGVLRDVFGEYREPVII
jgi:methylmalonyl-CoA mutase N-terminal domain/subunit